MCFRYLSTWSFWNQDSLLGTLFFTKKARYPWENIIKKTGNKEDYFNRKQAGGSSQHSTRNTGSNPHPDTCFVVLGKLTH